MLYGAFYVKELVLVTAVKAGQRGNGCASTVFASLKIPDSGAYVMTSFVNELIP